MGRASCLQKKNKNKIPHTHGEYHLVVLWATNYFLRRVKNVFAKYSEVEC